MNGNLDYRGSKQVLKSRFNEKLKTFLEKYDLVDVWRKRNPNKKQFTFRQKWPVVQSRLDYWFVSSSVQKLVNNCDILTSITPDHSCILLQFSNLRETFCYGKSYILEI